MLTVEYLRSRLNYDPITGSFTWKDGPRAGQLAGCDNGEGYVVIKVKDKRYRAHRLAWFYTYGEWPKLTIDHRNHERGGNALLNLRDVTQAINNRNRRVDVTYRKDRNRWRARVSIGSFSTREEAVAACYNAIRLIYPED